MKAAGTDKGDLRTEIWTENGGALANLAKIAPIAPFTENGAQTGEAELYLQVVIETPRGSRVKYKFDEDLRAMAFKSLLPAGMVFPFNFGFVPGTLGGDGDPLDVLLLTEEPLFPGCVVRARLVGAMTVEQTVDGQTQRNDRLLAVPEILDVYGSARSLEDLPEPLLAQIEAFFVQYHRLGGKTSRTLARLDARVSRDLLKEAIERFGK